MTRTRMIGLVVGVVVSFMSGSNTDVRYSILGALLSGAGVGYRLWRVPPITSFSRAIDLGMGSEDLAAVYAFRGIARVGLSMYDAALADFDEAIARDSTNAWVFYGRGAAYAGIGEMEKTILDLERALELGLDASVKPDTEAFLEILRQSTAP